MENILAGSALVPMGTGQRHIELMSEHSVIGMDVKSPCTEYVIDRDGSPVWAERVTFTGTRTSLERWIENWRSQDYLLEIVL